MPQRIELVRPPAGTTIRTDINSNYVSIPQSQKQSGEGAQWHPAGNSLSLLGSAPVAWNMCDTSVRVRMAMPWHGSPLAWSPDGTILLTQTNPSSRAPMDTLIFGPVEVRRADDVCRSQIVPLGGFRQNGTPMANPKRFVSADPSKKIGRIRTAEFSPDSKRLAVIDEFATIAVVDVPRQLEVMRETRAVEPATAGVASQESIPIFFDWATSGNLLVGVARESAPGVRSAVLIRQARGGDGFKPTNIQADARTTNAMYNPANPSQILVVGSDLSIVDANSHASIRSIPVGRAIKYAEWRPDGTQILSITDNDILQIWDAATGAQKRTLSARAASWSPNSARLAVSAAGTVTVQTSSSGEVVETLESNNDVVTGPFQWRPGGRGLIAQAHGPAGPVIYLWRAD